jgi:hypothetical protein
MKFKKVWLCVFTLLFMLSCFEGVSVSAETSKKRVWEYTTEFEMVSSAIEDANVYAEPDLKAEIVGKLKKTPPQIENDVLVLRAKILTDDRNVENQMFEYGDPIHECWWEITHPVSGWVEAEKLGLWTSGFFAGE